MKDPAHHRASVQKQILRSSRQEASSSQALSTLPIDSPVVQASTDSNHDRKRKMALDFVYPTSQRHRMH